MQPSTMSLCSDSIKSIPCSLSNWSDNQTLYGNFLGSDSVSVQEPLHFDSFDVFPASKETSFGLCDNTQVIDVIDPMNVDTSENMAMSASNGKRKDSPKRAWGAFLPLAIDIIKYSAPSPSAYGFQSDSDPRSQDNDSEDVYVPIGVRSQQTPNSLRSSSTQAASSSTSSSFPARKRPRSAMRTHGSAPSRNRQATTDQVEDIRARLSLCRINRERSRDLICPVIGCPYKQLNGRMPDYRRHVRTHIRRDAEIRCKGVPYQDFVRHRRLFPNVSVDAETYNVPGEDGLWIGGCLKTFSRGDALKRHQRNTYCVSRNHVRLH